MQAIKRYLIAGLLVLIPLTLTFLVVAWIFSFVDGTAGPWVETVLGRRIPGTGIAATLIVVLIAGILASHVIGGHILEFIQEAVFRIPVVGSIYKTSKQLVDAFSPESLASFKKVVTVEYPRPGTFSLGFVTNEVVLEKPNGEKEDLVCTYIPTNHVYFGDYVMFRKDQVYPTGLTIQQGIQCSLTAGAGIPRRLPVKKGLPKK